MYTLWVLRNTISTFLINFFGLFFPALDSIKTVVCNDQDGIRELVTYWTVWTACYYIELFFQYFAPATLAKYPPEFKLLFILWLTLPQFQGAFRLYVLIIRPYFEKYEDHIDEQIGIVTKGVRNKIGSSLNVLLYHLFLAPNEGILSISMTYAATSFMNLTQLNQNNNSKSSSNNNNNNNNSENLLQKRFLKGFSLLLKEGIFMKACLDNNIDIDNLNTIKMLTYECKLIRNEHILSFTLFDEKIGDELLKTKSDINIYIVVYRILSVSITDAETPTLITLTILNLDKHTEEYFILAEDVEECEAIVSGFNILIMNFRSKVLKKLGIGIKKLNMLNNYYNSENNCKISISKAFSRWKILYMNNIDSDSGSSETFSFDIDRLNCGYISDEDGFREIVDISEEIPSNSTIQNPSVSINKNENHIDMCNTISPRNNTTISILGDVDIHENSYINDITSLLMQEDDFNINMPAKQEISSLLSSMEGSF
jgi:hypothetical protein